MAENIENYMLRYFIIEKIKVFKIIIYHMSWTGLT